MAGAIRPPWIDKEMFYRMPFNFCDRWCEYCNLTAICRVFKDEQKRKRKYLKKGKDPDSMESVFETLNNTFKKVRKMINKDAKKWGIDLKEIKKDKDLIPEDPQPEEFPLYQLMTKFSKELEKVITDLSIAAAELNNQELEKAIEVISYYHLLLPPKIYRAILSKIEEEKDKDDTTFDSKTSAFIAVNSLTAIIEALMVLSKNKFLGKLRKETILLADTALDLIGLINSDFSLKTKN